jgi:penicillin amidase
MIRDVQNVGTMTADTSEGAPQSSRLDGFRALPKPLRVSTYLVIALVLVLVVALLAGVVAARRSFPQTTGTIELDVLDGEVEVIRDDHGIPQIYADSAHDLMVAQGFVAAQERFYEMDVRRHATAGRLAEMFGEDALETDMYVRTMGWRRVAQRELPLLQPDTRAALDAYADGVNAYLADRSPSEIALEYTVLNAGGLDYHPEEWTAVDSLAWLKAMAWDLRGNMQDEIDRVLSADLVGSKRATALFPPYPYDAHAPIVGQGAVVDGVFDQDATTGDAPDPRRPPFGTHALAELSGLREGLARMPAWLGRGDGIGSNSWVVDGERSTTGEPMLANDPHLGVSMPGVWLQVGLHCRTVSDACPYDVSGFSFSGVPGVIIGHNADIAWGFTNLGPDVTDLYLERIEGDTWRYGGERRPLRTRTETIEVADGDDVTMTVRSTKHGPVVSDVDETLEEVAGDTSLPRPEGDDVELAVSLAWTALKPRPTADAILELNRAEDWDSFRAALADFAAPSQNVVYADREGHIGYQAPGLVPIRKSGSDGTMPAAGWRPEDDWTGKYVPYEGLPHVLDPEEGFIATANQAVTGEDYPYLLTTDWDRGYRSQRIREVLADDDELSMEEMLDLQLDTLSPMAPTLVPHLLDVRLPRGYYSGGRQLLRDWDHRMDADSAAAAYYNVVWSNLLELTFDDELVGDARPDGGQRWFAVVTDLLDRPEDQFWDDRRTDETVEQRDDILTQALLDARDDLTALQSPNPDEWSWGDLHELELRSSTLGESGIGVVERLFNRGGWEVGGGGAIVNATSWDAREGFEVVAAPSMRMVVSMADLDDSRWINLTGVSGHAFNDHYTDQTDLWADGETLPWAFSRDAVERAAEDTLTLEPPPGGSS